MRMNRSVSQRDVLATKNQRRGRRITLPDATWLRREISIAEVARKLGLECDGSGRKFKCWRIHRGGETQWTLSLHAKTNTLRCFKCDSRSMSNIDLVVAVQSCDVGRAIRYLAALCPGAPRRDVLARRDRVRYSLLRGTMMSLQDIILSHGWAALSPGPKIVLTAIIARAPQAGSEQNVLRCTYGALMAWTGIRSRLTISRALKRLKDTGVIATELARTGIRNQRGFELKQLRVRVFPHALRAARSLRCASGSATSSPVHFVYRGTQYTSDMTCIQ